MSIFKAISGIALIIKVGIASVLLAGSFGMYAGVRWEKGRQYDLMVDRSAEITARYEEGIETLGERWQLAADNAKIDVQNWQIQDDADTTLFDKVLAGQAELGAKFNELNKDITITSDMGVCKLSPDAVRLLREASKTANSTRLPNS